MLELVLHMLKDLCLAKLRTNLHYFWSLMPQMYDLMLHKLSGRILNNQNHIICTNEVLKTPLGDRYRQVLINFPDFAERLELDIMAQKKKTIDIKGTGRSDPLNESIVSMFEKLSLSPKVDEKGTPLKGSYSQGEGINLGIFDEKLGEEVEEELLNDLRKEKGTLIEAHHIAANMSDSIDFDQIKALGLGDFGDESEDFLEGFALKELMDEVFGKSSANKKGSTATTPINSESAAMKVTESCDGDNNVGINELDFNETIAEEQNAATDMKRVFSLKKPSKSDKLRFKSRIPVHVERFLLLQQIETRL